MTGTFRCFDSDLRTQLLGSLKRTAEGVAASLRCTAKVTTEFLTPAVRNDPTATGIARAVAAEIVGPEHVIQPDPLTGSDDVAYFWQKAPGCYAFVGSARPEWSPAPAHHNAKFDIDESAMEIGADLLVRAARNVLTGA
jgi:amidohydrolase